jgi:UTP-glucose-1-phosphate uridylyltransferase
MVLSLSMPPALLVLAAGLGSRYGGLKQIEPVGPAGETLLDYAVFDALRAGFGRIVFVIRRDFEGIFRDKIGSKYAARAAVSYAFQEIGDLPPAFAPPAGRARPWGTGHAVWSARRVLAENFAVINADDFYGADAFAQLHSFLAARRSSAGVPSFGLGGFRLAETLSEHGAVARGVCRMEAGRLCGITEQTGITAGDVGPGRKFSGDEIASMNCWGFTPAVFPLIEARLADFLASRGGDAQAEFYLPEAISSLIARGAAEVEVLRVRGRWFGVTHPEDKARVVAAIAALVRSGAYPGSLA